MSYEVLPGTHFDFTKKDFKAARGVAVATKSNDSSSYDILFRFIEGRIVSRRRIQVAFA